MSDMPFPRRRWAAKVVREVSGYSPMRERVVATATVEGHGFSDEEALGNLLENLERRAEEVRRQIIEECYV